MVKKKKKLDKETWYAKFMHFADIVICIDSDKLHLILFVTKDFFFRISLNPTLH